MAQSLFSVCVEIGIFLCILCIVAWLIPCFSRKVYVVTHLSCIVFHNGEKEIMFDTPLLYPLWPMQLVSNMAIIWPYNKIDGKADSF